MIYDKARKHQELRPEAEIGDDVINGAPRHP
jgi:hypothetical protein